MKSERRSLSGSCKKTIRSRMEKDKVFPRESLTVSGWPLNFLYMALCLWARFFTFSVGKLSANFMPGFVRLRTGNLRFNRSLVLSRTSTTARMISSREDELESASVRRLTKENPLEKAFIITESRSLKLSSSCKGMYSSMRSSFFVDIDRKSVV